jgi:hypothetical protein
MRISKLRGLLYKTARGLGDYQAAKGGPKKIGRRVQRRVLGKLLGRLFRKL